MVAIQEALTKHSKEPVEFVEKSIQLLGRQVIPNKFYYPKSKYYPTMLHNIYRSAISDGYYKVLRECNDADLVIVGGGGVYMGYLFPLNNRFIPKIKTPMSIIGVGYNHNLGAPDFTKRQLESVRTLSSQANLQSVRDSRTVDFLKEQNINAELMCDPAIFLSERDTGLVKRKPGVINVGLNIARHGWNNQNKLKDILIDTYYQAVKQIQSKQKARIYYMMHQPNEQYYIDALQEKGIEFAGIIQVADARELKGAYANLDFTISMMLHSTILAFGAGVPSINVGYDDKNLAFMQMTGQAKRYVSVNELPSKKLLKIIDSTLDRLPMEKKSLKKYKAEFAHRFDSFIKRTVELIKR